MLLGHRRQYLPAYLLQKRLIAPRRSGHDMMQRLVHLPHVPRSQARGHRLDALAFDRQHEALHVVLHGHNAISMPGGLGQTAPDRLADAAAGEKNPVGGDFIALNVPPRICGHQKNQRKGALFITQ